MEANKFQPNAKLMKKWVGHTLQKVKASTVLSCWKKASLLPAISKPQDGVEVANVEEDIQTVQTIFTRVDSLVQEHSEERLDATELLSMPLECEIKGEPCYGDEVDKSEQESAVTDHMDDVPPLRITVHEAHAGAASFLSTNTQLLLTSARVLDMRYIRAFLHRMNSASLQQTVSPY